MTETAGHDKPGEPKQRSWIWGVLIVVGVLLLAGAGGATVHWWQNNHKTVPPAAVVNHSQNQALSGDYSSAQTDIDKALERTDLTNDDRYLLYYQKGTNAQNKGDYKVAMDNFNQALKYKQTQSLYTSMGETSEALGDKPGAIANYKKAIQAIPVENNPVGDEDKATLEKKIESLEAAS